MDRIDPNNNTLMHSFLSSTGYHLFFWIHIALNKAWQPHNPTQSISRLDFFRLVFVNLVKPLKRGKCF